MSNVVKRFIKEAICREELKLYNAVYRLSNGKYYHIIVEAYDLKDAERQSKRRLSDASYHEYEPTEDMKELVEMNDYLYVFYRGKAE